uniref:Uncharacterized protein n=1 Tax=Kalanchoe fedtschenkoi TaxID=63787 RepID=A0A7N0V1M2_KALFE
MAESVVISLAFKLSSLLIKEVQLMSNIESSVKNIIYESTAMRAFLRRADASEQSDLELEQWVSEVRDLAFKVEDVIDEYIMLSSAAFQPIKIVGAQHDIVKRMEELKDLFGEARARFDRYDWYDPQEDAMFQTEQDLVGINIPKETLIKLLVQGLGKTTLVNQVYETAAVKNHFVSHAWINVSKTSTVEDLLKDLIKQLYDESCLSWVPQDFETMKSFDLKKKVNELLSGKRYVIILDDLQTVDQWDGSRNAFPNNNCRSRVVVTTRSADVATTVWKSEDYIYNLEPLSITNSWELFSKKAFKDGFCPPDYFEVSTKILKKYKWVMVNNRLGGELEENQKLKSIYRIISHSYHYLPYHLKPCFLYMGLFPEDQPIGRLRLLRLWVAEGFLEEKNEMTPGEVAENYLNQLLDRNMVQVAIRTSDGREKAYTIHSVLREIILARSRAQKFASVTNNGLLSKVTRRLSLHNNLLGIGNEDENYQSLRSFLMFDVEKPLNKTSMPTLYGGFKLLAVLDLQGANLEKFPTFIVQLLNLRYLSLKNTKVDSIPSTIYRLQKLEILDLKCTLVTKLPLRIVELKRLRSLLVYRYDRDINRSLPSKYGFKAPKGGMGNLRRLEKLCFVEASNDSGKLVKEVELLTELQRLGIVKLSEKNGKALCSSIASLKKLIALSITSSKDHKLDLGYLKHPPHLQRLYLTGQLESLPTWIGNLKYLVKIYLKSSKLDENPLTTLEKLPNLVHIELLQAYTGKEMCFSNGTLKKLKILGLREFATLNKVTVEANAMPNLENLLLQGCPLLKTLPQGIGYLYKLQVLDFVEMPEDIISKLQPPPKAGEDYKSIQHIPQVRFSCKVNDMWVIRRLSTDMTNPGDLDKSSGTDWEHNMKKLLKK